MVFDSHPSYSGSLCRRQVAYGFVAMVSSIVLALTGTMEVKQIYAGWSSNLVLMLIGMMIVGQAMFETGAVIMIGRPIMKAKWASNERSVMIALMLISGILSAFLSNTAVVATFIPLIGAMVASSKGKLHQKYLMMPPGLRRRVGRHPHRHRLHLSAYGQHCTGGARPGADGHVC